MGTGLAIGFASIFIRIQARFTIIFFVGLFAILAMTFVVRRLVKPGDKPRN
jgi:hypothetical protein